MLDIWLLHHLQKLARIGAQRFDIATLPLCVDGVKREAGFAGTGQASDNNELVARQVDIDALEIMLARTAHLDVGE